MVPMIAYITTSLEGKPDQEREREDRKRQTHRYGSGVGQIDSLTDGGQ
jgi:hypothetical protein